LFLTLWLQADVLSSIPSHDKRTTEWLDKTSLITEKKLAVTNCCDAADALQEFAPLLVRVHACASKISFSTPSTCVVLCAADEKKNSFEVVKPDMYAFRLRRSVSSFIIRTGCPLLSCQFTKQG
jgi:hypothetical protein